MASSSPWRGVVVAWSGSNAAVERAALSCILHPVFWILILARLGLRNRRSIRRAIHHAPLQVICDLEHDTRSSPPQHSFALPFFHLVILGVGSFFRIIRLGRRLLLKPLPDRVDHLPEPVKIQTVQHEVAGQVRDGQPYRHALRPRPEKLHHLALRRHALRPSKAQPSISRDEEVLPTHRHVAGE